MVAVATPDGSFFDLLYAEALSRCNPGTLTAGAFDLLDPAGRESLPVLAIGKCAAAMTMGLVDRDWGGPALVVVPKGYEGDARLSRNVRLVLGTHPHPDHPSFLAGEAVRDFASSLENPALVLVSGGASATVEIPLEPHFTREDLTAMNSLLIRSGLPIGSINCVRKHLSAIKGGRLMEMLPSGSFAWILSDVPTGSPELVGSGPTYADPSSLGEAADLLEGLGDELAERLARALRSGVIPETPKKSVMQNRVLADNDSLTRAMRESATARGWSAIQPGRQLDDDVETVASVLASAIPSLGAKELFVAGGEPSVVVGGGGHGGRCSELGLRLLRAAALRRLPPFGGLIASSDGRDGNSGAAGYRIRWDPGTDLPIAAIDAALARSDAHPLLSELGEAIIMAPTGNNLRDIMVMARG